MVGAIRGTIEIGGGAVKTIICALLLCSACFGTDLVARDSNGLVVEIREQYGAVIIDTCTVVMVHDGAFYIVKKSGLTGVYPVARHSVKILQRGK